MRVLNLLIVAIELVYCIGEYCILDLYLPHSLMQIDMFSRGSYACVCVNLTNT